MLPSPLLSLLSLKFFFCFLVFNAFLFHWTEMQGVFLQVANGPRRSFAGRSATLHRTQLGIFLFLMLCSFAGRSATLH
jgi:hypothetical protein